MGQFLNTFPKGLVAFGAIVLGFILIWINDPPKTVCDAQMALFRDSQKSFLYSATEFGKPSTAKEAYDICKADNSPGGCFRFFELLKRMNSDIGNIPEQCAETAATDEKIGLWLQRSLALMVQMAWGEKAPASYVQKNGWFDGADIALFCDLKRSTIHLFGDDVYAQWRESMLMSLPEFEKVGREQAWAKSLVSTPCDHYR